MPVIQHALSTYLEIALAHDNKELTNIPSIKSCQDGDMNLIGRDQSR